MEELSTSVHGDMEELSASVYGDMEELSASVPRFTETKETICDLYYRMFIVSYTGGAKMWSTR